MLYSLQSFLVAQPENIFDEAVDLPSFFDTNLNDANRIVNRFREDSDGCLRIFYFQYFRLCFEQESSAAESYIERIESILESEWFQFKFTQEEDSHIYNHNQFKTLLVEFIQLLSSTDLSVCSAIESYPIMDVLLIRFFRSILVIAEKTLSIDSPIDYQSTTEFLASYFEIEVKMYGKCLKFEEADVFLYAEAPNDLFLAYISASNLEGQSQISSKPASSLLKPSSSSITEKENQKVQSDPNNKSPIKIAPETSQLKKVTEDRMKDEYNHEKPVSEKKILAETPSLNPINYSKPTPENTHSNYGGLSMTDQQPKSFSEQLQIGYSEETLHTAKFQKEKQPFVIKTEISTGTASSQDYQQPIESPKYGSSDYHYSANLEFPSAVMKDIMSIRTEDRTARTAQTSRSRPDLGILNATQTYDSYASPRTSYNGSTAKAVAVEPLKASHSASWLLTSSTARSDRFSDTKLRPFVDYTAGTQTRTNYNLLGSGPIVTKQHQTIYINPKKDFTNSFILEKVNEPHRTNIRLIKARALKQQVIR